MESGTIKVVWHKKNEPNVVFSKMFKNLADARAYATGLDNYMIMELDSNNQDDYNWKLLNYGDFRLYKLAIKVLKNPILVASSVGVSVYGLYKLIKK